MDDIVVTYPEKPDFEQPAALLVDKPVGPTSFDVVRSVRRLSNVRKVGHAGTLDPMATGLLIVLVRRGATKRMRDFMNMVKVYEGTLRLGETTPSYDTETPVEEKKPWEHLQWETLREVRQTFLGQQTQRPPLYSAVRVDGERLYKKARRGEKASRPPRQVRIDEFELIEQTGPDVQFRVTCSKGTYIRSLAHDFGKRLDVGAHLVALRRTAIGSHAVDEAWPLQKLEDEGTTQAA